MYRLFLLHAFAIPFALALAVAGCASEISVACPAGHKLSVDGSACEPALTNEPGDADASVDPDGSVDARGACLGIDCEDGNECTADSCADDVCLFTPVEDGTACLFEERAGVCEAGACVRDCEAEDCRIVYPCTEQGLRDAIEDGGNTVIGCNGPTTVVLTEGELDMFKDVSIDGLGNLTVDAEGRSRVFVANETATLVELTGMNITGGSAGKTDGSDSNEENGGAVFGSYLSSVTVRDCRIYGNTADNHGGAIRGGAVLAVIDSDVTENAAAGRGGGIATFAEALIVDSRVANNSAMDDGGGFYTTGANGRMLVQGSLIEGNHAASNGGGIWASAPLTLEDCAVRDNSTAGSGGGLRNWMSEVRATKGTVFSDNTAANAAGISSVDGQLFFDQVTITRNAAEGGNGGGLYAEGKTVLEMSDSLVSDNSARVGGGLYARGATFTIATSTISGNSADWGAGMRVYETSRSEYDLSLENCTMSGNHANIAGGAIQSRDSTKLVLDQVTMSGNTAPAGSGIHQDRFASTEARHTVIDNGCFTDADSPLISLGHNRYLSADPEECAFSELDGATTDQLLSSEEIALGELELSGGPTPTHMPAPASALIDAIPPGECSAEISEDQRGEPRGGSACDIGSVEVQPSD